MTDQQLLERISINPKVMVGKPVIRGTRLTVKYILNLWAHGTSVAEILEEYEGLVQEDILACLLFAARSLESTSFMPLAEVRFLVDESTGPAVARWLQEQGHAVFSVYDEARGMDDDRICGRHFPRTGY